MERVRGGDSPLGKRSLGFPARDSVIGLLETLPALLQGQDVPRIVLNERRDLFFLSGVCRWPGSPLLSRLLPIPGAGSRGILPMDLSRFSTGWATALELRDRWPDCMRPGVCGDRGVHHVLAARPRADGSTNSGWKEHRPSQD